jgi:hypothetical protein
MAALSMEAASSVATATLGPIVRTPADDLFKAATGGAGIACRRAPSWTLSLSRSRTHNAVLDILRAHKVSGNFHVNLEAVLKDMGALDKVTFQVQQDPGLGGFPDCRHVAFWPNEDVPDATFEEIVSAIAARIGFDAPWWGRLFRRFHSGIG